MPPAQTETQETKERNKAPLGLMTLIVFFAGLILSVFFYYYITSAPHSNASIQTLRIEKGMTAKEIAESAKGVGIVRSSLALYAILTYAYNPTSIYAGTYSFDKQYNVFKVAEKIASNDVNVQQERITIPEGVTRKEIAKIAKQKIASFDEMLFLEETKNNEGYLFPDTYFVDPDFSAEQFVSLLTQTFAIKLAPYTNDIEASEFTEYEILVLASILEREANDEESMKMVSGILQNRLSIGMALQTDASIEYVLDKPLQELVPEDLKIDTPYNTYLYPGLPPSPIGNPGLQAIMAVLYPTPSPYMFYITGDDGVFYYAETFEEHKRNIEKYLR